MANHRRDHLRVGALIAPLEPWRTGGINRRELVHAEPTAHTRSVRGLAALTPAGASFLDWLLPRDQLLLDDLQNVSRQVSQ